MADKNIWDYLLKQLGNEYGVAGLMGNIYACLLYTSDAADEL